MTNISTKRALRLNQLAQQIRETQYDEQQAEIQPPDWTLIAELYSKIWKLDTREIIQEAIYYYESTDFDDIAAYFESILNSLEQAEDNEDIDGAVRILSHYDNELSVLRTVFGSKEYWENVAWKN